MTTLVWARPEALWLLLLVPLLAVAGLWLGVRRNRLRPAALAWRVAVVALLAIGLAEPLLASGAGAGGAVFVVDRSESIGAEARDMADRWLEDALAAAPSGHRATIVEFGAKPVLSVPPGAASEVAGGVGGDASAQDQEPLDPAFTDISAALGLGRALPLGGGRRLVLVSDGGENIGQAIDQAAQAAGEGVPIDVVALPGVNAADLRVDGVAAPASAWEGEPVSVLAGVETGRGGPATVELLVDGVVKQTIETDLAEGLTSQAFTLTDLASGFHALEVRVQGEAEANRRTDDDRVRHGIVVRERPRLLLV
ncbi:MAG: von Willebrand factor, type, partial [Thermomicrobiales bacterium]|nr:von Willebrand factor, type [Thermomicrobiales bacterium]